MHGKGSGQGDAHRIVRSLPSFAFPALYGPRWVEGGRGRSNRPAAIVALMSIPGPRSSPRTRESPTGRRASQTAREPPVSRNPGQNSTIVQRWPCPMFSRWTVSACHLSMLRHPKRRFVRVPHRPVANFFEDCRFFFASFPFVVRFKPQKIHGT